MCTLFFKDRTISNIHKEKNENRILKNDVWYDFVFDTDNEIELPYNEVLREFLIDKILLDVSLNELINDGFIKIDY